MHEHRILGRSHPEKGPIMRWVLGSGRSNGFWGWAFWDGSGVGLQRHIEE